jgi:hypothetical protein
MKIFIEFFYFTKFNPIQFSLEQWRAFPLFMWILESELTLHPFIVHGGSGDSTAVCKV